MDNMLPSIGIEMKQFLETLFSTTDSEINTIIEDGSKELELYLDAAAEKFQKKRGRKPKKAVSTTDDAEQKPLLLNKTENVSEFKRPTRVASKIASQKMKNDLAMPLTRKLRRVEDSEGNYLIHSDHSVVSNVNIKQERISEELVNQDVMCTSEFENPNSTCYLMQAIEEIVQSTPAPLPTPGISSFEASIEQKPLILNETVVLPAIESIQLDLGLNVTTQTESSDKEEKSVKRSKRTKTKRKKTVNPSTDSSSGGLSSVGSPQPMRVTRTKTRAMATSAALSSDLESCKENIAAAKKYKNTPLKQDKIISNGNNTSKVITTVNKNSKLPLALNNSCTANWSRTLNNGNPPSKVGMIVSHLESFITKTKPVPVSLATKQLEDVQMREEKAAEAEKKREKLLKEKAENQKRINEAKQLKVQQAREQLEYQKKEKLRQIQMKKAEALKKQKELENSDLKEKVRLQENQKKEQAKSSAEQEERNEKLKPVKVNQQVIQKPQSNLNTTYVASSDKTAEPSNQRKLFGIDDIYSGESSEEEKEKISKKIFPSWTLPENRERILRIQHHVPFEIIKEFIVCGEQTPDLTKIFKNVPKKALTRTSSAIWNTPPLKKC